jgi:DNA invertase Pin-like site-specific DNA recombinase
MKRAVLYLRVSTQDQTTANQERELREIAGRMGCDVVKVYKDHGISGAKGRDKRPAFDALCRAATRREFDVVMAWSVDRLGRSLQDLVGFLSELHALGIDLFLHQQGLDTTTPAGKAMFQMMGVFAEFERAMIQERVPRARHDPRTSPCWPGAGQERRKAARAASDRSRARRTHQKGSSDSRGVIGVHSLRPGSSRVDSVEARSVGRDRSEADKAVGSDSTAPPPGTPARAASKPAARA